MAAEEVISIVEHNSSGFEVWDSITIRIKQKTKIAIMNKYLKQNFQKLPINLINVMIHPLKGGHRRLTSLRINATGSQEGFLRNLAL